MMAAYHESRVKALSEYFALRYPNTPRVIHFGRSSDVGWQSKTIDSVEEVKSTLESLYTWKPNANSTLYQIND